MPVVKVEGLEKEDGEEDEEDEEEEQEDVGFRFALEPKDASISFHRLTSYEDASQTVGPSIVLDLKLSE